MITITEAALAKFQELIEAKDEPDLALRVAVRGRGPNGFEYDLRIIKDDEKNDGDTLAKAGDLSVYVDGETGHQLEGSTIDFLPAAGGFKIDNPNPIFADALEQEVHDVIVGQINPGIASHGGFVTLLEVKDKVAYIQLGGGCVGCGLVDVTLKQGIEVMIKEAVPVIESVVDTTDHASGTNPYYAPTKGGGHHQPGKGGAAPQSSPFG